MIKNIIKKIKISRNPHSHKGKNGKVLVIGGSIDFHGAPIFAAKGALVSGADLVRVVVPECNFDVTRAGNPELIVLKYPGEYLSSRALDIILTAAQKVDVVIMGPGMGDRPETLKNLKNLILNLQMPLVLDSIAIQALGTIEKMPLNKPIIITPHHTEMEKLIGKLFKISDPIEHKSRIIRTLAHDLKINILLKGPTDLIAAENGDFAVNSTGNSGMTKGGTGDVLSGLIAGLISQGLKPFEACNLAAFANGMAGDKLKIQKGFLYSTNDLLNEIPLILKNTII